LELKKKIASLKEVDAMKGDLKGVPEVLLKKEEVEVEKLSKWVGSERTLLM